MSPLHFPKAFEHHHPPIQNVHVLFEKHLSLGQRAADKVATFAGSWHFILGQSVLLIIWIIINVTAYVNHWDPYPFILMNLLLSMQAAYTAPIIMMSQNRQAERDRLEAHNDYEVNVKAEKEVLVILEHLDAQNQALTEIHEVVSALERRLADVGGASPQQA